MEGKIQATMRSRNVTGGLLMTTSHVPVQNCVHDNSDDVQSVE